LEAKGPKNYLVKRQGNESVEHALLCWAIVQELKQRGFDAKNNPSVKADVTVIVNKKKISFEVETGDNLIKRGAEKIIEKMSIIEKECDKLYIVVTDRHMKGKYQTITRVETITRTEVVEMIDKLVKGQ
jgi:hypothetical protein